MRVGEARRLRWIDIDFQRRVVIMNAPEKNGNPRIYNVSKTLINMLNALPRKSERIFGLSSKAEKSETSKNRFPHFQTLESDNGVHRTRIFFTFKDCLGTKTSRILSMIYIDVERALFQTSNDEFHVRVARSPEEIKALLEVGFEYVCEKDGLLFFRKRK